MTTRCVACGGETGEDALRCGSCGLAFGTARKEPFVPAAAPGHVELYLGNAPTLVPDESGAPDLEAAPAPPPLRAGAPRQSRLPWVVAIVVASVVASIAAAALLVRTRPDDSWTQLERSFEAYADVLPDDDELPPLDADAALREFERSSPEAFAAARIAYRPLTPPAGPSLHVFGDVLVARIAEISPDAAYVLGVPVSSSAGAPVPEAAFAAEILLVTDAWRVVRTWRERGDLTPHDRADGDALLGWLGAYLLESQDNDTRVVAWLRDAFAVLPHIEVDETSPADVRAARAAARLRALAPQLRSAVDSLKNPPRAAVLDAAAALESAARHLSAYPGSWYGLSGAQSADLGEAAAAARDAASTCAGVLRNVVALRAKGNSGMGADVLAARLRLFYGLDLTPREAYERALDELRSSHDEMRALYPEAERDATPIHHDSDGSCVETLHRLMSRWVTEVPAEPLPRILQTPELWAHEDAAAWYMDPGPLGPAGRAVIFVAKPAEHDAAEGPAWMRPRRHMFAHETYPGHRLQALIERSACVVRRLVDDRMNREGWARYAEELIHETGSCSAAPRDVYSRIADRRGFALTAMAAVVAAARAADDHGILGLYREMGYASPTLEQVGALGAWGDYPLCYLLGRDEVFALRREEEERLGDAFDLRAFHTRFLREGPIPVPLIRRQWREENERR